MSNETTGWKHLSGICFDIETISNKTDACIMSIGAVVFDIDSGKIEKEIKLNCDVKQGLALGLSRTDDTLDFWKSVPDDLKNNAKNPAPYEQCLREFAQYCSNINPKMFWCFRPHFTLAVINKSLEAIGYEHQLPWQYNNVCDVNTIKHSFSETIAKPFNSLCPQEDSKNYAQFITNFFKDIS